METSYDLATNAIPRLTDEVSEKAKIQMLNMRILSTRWKPEAAEAFAPLSGLDNLQRFTVPIGLYNQGFAQRMFIGRAAHDEVTFHALDIRGLRRHCGLKRTAGVESVLGFTNTLNQTQWVVNRVLETRTKSAAIFTDAFHILRALATAIQAMGDNWFPVIPFATGQLDDPVPEMVKNGQLKYGYDLVAMEIERFEKYSHPDRINPATGKPDIASADTVHAYLNWMRDMHPHLYQ